MLYLLDTNTVSYVIKGRPIRVRERLVSIPMEQLSISVVTEAELLFGVARHPEATRLKLAVHEFLIRLRILPWNSDTARSYANLRADLERRGTTMGNLDLMIAAQALADHATLVSSDRTFRRIRQLQIEDWTKD
jgi:tRNA(fMet)-specific endonuclease VapC